MKVSQVLSKFLYDTTTNLLNMDFFNKVVSFDNSPANVGSGESSLLLAGPPVLDAVVNAGAGKNIQDLLIPIGAAQGIQFSESQAVTPFKEIGSTLDRQAIGATNYSLGLSRVLTAYGNLEYSLYSWLYPWLPENDKTLELTIAPGVNDERHFTSNESELFYIPFGLLLITGTAGGSVVTAEYMERCFIAAGGAGKSAGNPLIVQQVNIIVTRPVLFTTSAGDSLLGKNYTLNKAGTINYKVPNPKQSVVAAA
jgi:hypothetical protein